MLCVLLPISDGFDGRPCMAEVACARGFRRHGLAGRDVMRMSLSIAGLVLILAGLTPALRAQASQPPLKVYSGNFGAGFSFTGGNSDTSSFNLSGEFTRDPKKKNVIKLKGFYLRSSANNEATADRLTLGFRDEYTFAKRTFVYGAFGYLRDPFKDISYLLNPQGGIGYKAVATDRTELTFSGGAGAVWEKNSGVDVQTSGTINAGEDFSYKLLATSKLTQGFLAFWKTSDFNDAFYHFTVAVSTALFKMAELKVEFVDDFKNVTPNPAIKKNDTAFIISFLYKF
jgi:putative salt-induced outer membrane protein YdiY